MAVIRTLAVLSCATLTIACGKKADAPPPPEPEATVDVSTTTGSVGDGEEMSRAQELERQLAGDASSGGEEAPDPQTEEWLAILRAELPAEFCKDGAFFRACFNVTKSECMRVSAIEFDVCVKRHRKELPKIRTVEDGGKGGEILGRCTGERYYDALEAKFKNTAKCNDPSKW